MYLNGKFITTSPYKSGLFQLYRKMQPLNWYFQENKTIMMLLSGIMA